MRKSLTLTAIAVCVSASLGRSQALSSSVAAVKKRVTFRSDGATASEERGGFTFGRTMRWRFSLGKSDEAALSELL